MRAGVLEGYAVPAPLVVPVVLISNSGVPEIAAISDMWSKVLYTKIGVVITVNTKILAHKKIQSI